MFLYPRTTWYECVRVMTLLLISEAVFLENVICYRLSYTGQLRTNILHPNHDLATFFTERAMQHLTRSEFRHHRRWKGQLPTKPDPKSSQIHQLSLEDNVDEFEQFFWTISQQLKSGVGPVDDGSATAGRHACGLSHVTGEATEQHATPRRTITANDEKLNRDEKLKLRLLQKLKSISRTRPTEYSMKQYPLAYEPGSAQRETSVARSRRRRSTGYFAGSEPMNSQQMYGQVFDKRVISWRIVHNSTRISYNSLQQTMQQALRKWSEVSPLVFVEDTTSPISQVDIQIVFGRGRHGNCPNIFDRQGIQLSHAWHLSNIHFNDDAAFTIRSRRGTSLLKVAVHEIGHVLGLRHSSRVLSVMHAVYRPYNPKNYELDDGDRDDIQSIYGQCETKFDAMFDWVRHGATGRLMYRTYFFSSGWCWRYDNSQQRPRYGYPQPIHNKWTGLPDNIDAVVHIRTSNTDKLYYFYDHMYGRYDSDNNEAFEEDEDGVYPRLIVEGWPALPGYPAIPNNIDAAYFDQRDGNVYFLKESEVYAYDVGAGGCCLDGYPKPIEEVYLTEPDSTPLPSNIDSAYYSYRDNAMYFIKGNEYWINENYNPSDVVFTNNVSGPYFVNEKWKDVCHVEPVD